MKLIQNYSCNTDYDSHEINYALPLDGAAEIANPDCIYRYTNSIPAYTPFAAYEHAIEKRYLLVNEHAMYEYIAYTDGIGQCMFFNELWRIDDKWEARYKLSWYQKMVPIPVWQKLKDVNDDEFPF